MEPGVAVIIINSFTKEVGVVGCKNYEEAEKFLEQMYLETLAESEEFIIEDTYINKDKRYAQIKYEFETTEFRTGEIWPVETII